jgi:hypothetical protein
MGKLGDIEVHLDGILLGGLSTTMMDTLEVRV